MMSSSIDSDKDISDVLKSIRDLKMQIRKLEKKKETRIRQIFKKSLPSVVASHKWVIAFQPDNDSYQDFFSLSLDIIPDDKAKPLYRVGSHYKKNNIARKAVLPRIRAAQNGNLVATPAASLGKKFVDVGGPKNIDNMERLWFFSEKYDVYYLIYNRCEINISYSRLTVTSRKSMDDVFSVIRDLKFPLDFASYLKDIESSEDLIKRKKKLLGEIAPTILFSM
jgi:hypothetical protein